MDERSGEGFAWLRRAVGALGVLLPFAVSGVCYFGDERCTLQDSISDYYHTDVRLIFVGVLLAVAVLLWTYPGYDREDNLAGNAAAVFAFGVALFPTSSSAHPVGRELVLSWLHYLSAACMFGMLAVFCLVLFRRTESDRTAVQARQCQPGFGARYLGVLRREAPKQLGAAKRRRNDVYRVCGWLIIGCMLAMLIIGTTPLGDLVENARPIWVLETLSLVAFGVAWSVKGEVALRDTEPSR